MNSRKLSYDEMARAKRAFIQNLPDTVVLSYYEIECLIQAVHGALAQQAQEPHDEHCIGRHACIVAPGIAISQPRGERFDSMHQQAQPRCEHDETIFPHPYYAIASDATRWGEKDIRECFGPVAAPQPERTLPHAQPEPEDAQKEAGPHPSYDVPTLPEHHTTEPEDALADELEREAMFADGKSAHLTRYHSDLFRRTAAALRAVSQPTREQVEALPKHAMWYSGDVHEMVMRDDVLALYGKSEAKP